MVLVLALATVPIRAKEAGSSGLLVRRTSSGSWADRQQAADLLNGRQVVLRLYLDWKTDPKAYVTLRVPLEGLDVTFDAVRLAYAQRKSAGRDPNSLELSDEAKSALDQELKNAVVVVMPAEQQDPAITAVLNDCIFGKPYRSRLRLTPPPVIPRLNCIHAGSWMLYNPSRTRRWRSSSQRIRQQSPYTSMRFGSATEKLDHGPDAITEVLLHLPPCSLLSSVIHRIGPVRPNGTASGPTPTAMFLSASVPCPRTNGASSWMPWAIRYPVRWSRYSTG
jgi:hypothetical protein